MRNDAQNLLSKLGRKDFRYREFSDAFADMELWPIFEALLIDERIVGKSLSALEKREAEGSSHSVRKHAPATRRPESPHKPTIFDDLFAAYGQRPGEAGESAATSQGDLRGFLTNLSSKRG
jgi:hypothetical protein